MAEPDPKQSTTSTIGEGFVADRQIFWSRFTKFTTGAVIAIVVLLLILLVFVA